MTNDNNIAPFSTHFFLDAFDISGDKIMGRQAAGNSYLNALFRENFDEISLYISDVNNDPRNKINYDKIVNFLNTALTKTNDPKVNLIPYDTQALFFDCDIFFSMGCNSYSSIKDLDARINEVVPIGSNSLNYYLLEKYDISKGNAQLISILMDWDRTGGRLQSELRRRMEGMDIKISEELRQVLMKALKPETRVVESLRAMAYELGPFIDEYDEC